MIYLLAMLASMSPDQLSCSASRSRVDIAIPASTDPSIRSIAVVRAGRWYTILDDDHRLAPYRPGGRKLVLPRATQMAVAYRNGRQHVVRAFPTPGTYRIVFADNLETEPENMTALSCTVRLR